MRAAVLMALVLAACSNGAATAEDARATADAKLREVMPQTHPETWEATIRDMEGNWRVDYTPGTGGATVDVDKHTGKAVVIEIQQ
jgi:ABC-type glycerol-3-phosphate transport system substrate-binding protein